MRLCLVAVLVFALFVVPAAWADKGGIPHNPHDAVHTVTIGIVNEFGVAGTFNPLSVADFQEVTGEDGQLHFYYEYNAPDQETGLALMANDGVTVLGYLMNLVMDGKPDPQIVLNFACKAAPGAASTFSFISSVDVVPYLENASAYADATVTLTDNSVPLNGATITGLFGGDIYQARYNDGTVFTNLVAGFSNPVGTRQQTLGESDPLTGYTALGGTVTKTTAEYKFTLSRNDSASGTSQFVIIGTQVPEPSSILGCCAGLIGMIGFAVRRRR